MPDLILTHHDDDRHQDHRLISQFTWNTWQNHMIFEYEIMKYDGDLGRPNSSFRFRQTFAGTRSRACSRRFPRRRSGNGSTRRRSGRCSACAASSAMRPRASPKHSSCARSWLSFGRVPQRRRRLAFLLVKSPAPPTDCKRLKDAMSPLRELESIGFVPSGMAGRLVLGPAPCGHFAAKSEEPLSISCLWALLHSAPVSKNDTHSCHQWYQRRGRPERTHVVILIRSEACGRRAMAKPLRLPVKGRGC